MTNSGVNYSVRVSGFERDTRQGACVEVAFPKYKFPAIEIHRVWIINMFEKRNY